MLSPNTHHYDISGEFLTLTTVAVSVDHCRAKYKRNTDDTLVYVELRFRAMQSNKMTLAAYFLLHVFLAFAVEANRVHPLKRIIKISLAVSKAAYLPILRKRYLQHGAIIENPTTILPRRFLGLIFLHPRYDFTRDRVACSIHGWKAKHYEVKETEVFLFTHTEQKLAVFGFRGTEALNLLDWKWNFNVVPTRTYIDKTVFVTHSGFRNRYLNIAPWFEAEYLKIPQNYTIIITGHSLGGAEATIAAVFAAGKLKRRPDAVITYGSPLVGDQSFKSFYETIVGCNQTLRIVAKGDLFSAVPKVFGYTHVCPELKIDGKTGLSFINAHDLYTGYDRGLARLYNRNDIGFGCNKSL